MIDMFHYLKYIFKLLFGFMVIVALDVILRKADPNIGWWWFCLTLMFYNGYVYLEYRLTDKD